MKDIKTRTVVKDIKRLDRLPNLMDRVKHSSARTKQHKDNDKTTSQSPNEYAQHHSASSIDKTVRVQIGMIVVASKRLTRRRAKPEGNTVSMQNPAAIITKPSRTHQSRLARRLHLRKPVDGKYLLSSSQQAGKQRFIRSRVNARLLHPSRKDSFPDRIREGRHQEPAGKKGAFAAAASHSANVRGNRPRALTSESLRKRHFRPPSSRIPFAISKQAGHTIKRKERKFKALSPFIKTGQRLGQAKSHSDIQAEGKMNSARTAQRTAQMATARRSIQRAQAAARLNLRIIKMVVKAVALLVKGVAALLGISSTVIVLLCIVMAIAAVISSPFSIFVSGENTDADVKPLSRIVQELDIEFADRLTEIQQSAGHVDRVEFYYPGSADNTRIDNWMDIIAVFAVKTVMDSENGMDVATLDATRIDIIQSVFWDMNQLESHVEKIEHTETVTVEHEDGSTSEETTTSYEHILHITISSKTAEQQANSYHFTNEQKDIMKEMMSGEFRPLMFAILGKETDIGLTPGQLVDVQQHLPEGEIGSEVVKLALTRLGDPYSQPKAGQDDFTDCSYLVQWVYRQIGINLPRTAAEQARFSVENGLIVSAADLVPGDLVFWSYERNGRFMDITHVGIYAGNGKVVDASSSRGQVVYRKLFDSDKQVLFGRPAIKM
ncbi:C40 family peptidase [Paenibacillus alginolyticus]|uniref:C40 family peptidase n=1 Tax=Paenibacillus alginolyticus TaxID=59839 RepID=UPI00040C4E9D|nr:C40 family peptidase [Paenibacillus alginolyticus]MCY9667638.1 C40 family peptidase [Paenibacillus alginolyticus]